MSTATVFEKLAPPLGEYVCLLGIAFIEYDVQIERPIRNPIEPLRLNRFG